MLNDTSASLNLDGKMPWEKERLSRVEMSSEITQEKDLMSDVGINMKSWQKDLAKAELRSLATLAAVTSWKIMIGIVVKVLSGKELE